jgi:hypothetical protein
MAKLPRRRFLLFMVAISLYSSLMKYFCDICVPDRLHRHHIIISVTEQLTVTFLLETRMVFAVETATESVARRLYSALTDDG